MVKDEYQKLMDDTLTAINKRYVIGVTPWVEEEPTLSNRAQEVERHVIRVWVDRISIQRFKEVLIEYYRFWLKATRDYISRKA